MTFEEAKELANKLNEGVVPHRPKEPEYDEDGNELADGEPDHGPAVGVILRYAKDNNHETDKYLFGQMDPTAESGVDIRIYLTDLKKIAETFPKTLVHRFDNSLRTVSIYSRLQVGVTLAFFADIVVHELDEENPNIFFETAELRLDGWGPHPALPYGEYWCTEPLYVMAKYFPKEDDPNQLRTSIFDRESPDGNEGEEYYLELSVLRSDGSWSDPIKFDDAIRIRDEFRKLWYSTVG